MKPPLVSVLVTAYNSEDCLDKMLGSLLCQNYRHIEIIVVDDGSDDRTPIILKDLQNQDQRIKPFFPGRVGRAKALNLGLSKCSGKYIAINDADDFSKNARIKKQVNFLEVHPEIGMLGSRMEISEDGGTWIDDVVIEDYDIRRTFITGQPIQHSTVMFRKQIIDQVGGYNENIKFLFDRDIFLRVSKITKMHQLDDVLITLNRSSSQYFKSRFTGIERKWMSTKYQLKAVSQFNFSPYYMLDILAKFLWSVILELKNGLKSNE